MSKNYEEMSDFEINKSIAKLIYNHPKDSEYFKFYRLDEGSAVQVNACKMWPQNLDFCNYPQDAWPVIVSNEIDIIHNGMGCALATDNAIDLMKGSDDVIFFQDENPLRAAMVCFLMMKDSEK